MSENNGEVVSFPEITNESPKGIAEEIESVETPEKGEDRSEEGGEEKQVEFRNLSDGEAEVFDLLMLLAEEAAMRFEGMSLELLDVPDEVINVLSALRTIGITIIESREVSK